MKSKMIYIITIFTFITLVCAYWLTISLLVEDDGPISVKEFNNNRDEYGRYYKDYKEGDVVHIKDKVYDVELLKIPEIEINTTGLSEPRFSNFTGNYLTFTKVTFSNNESLNFTGNRTAEFKIGEIVTLNLPIEKYSNVPLTPSPYALAECHYNSFYLSLHDLIYWYATVPDIHITFQVEEINNTGCVINITSYIVNTPSVVLSDWSSVLSLWANGSKIEEFILSEIKENSYIVYEWGDNLYGWKGSRIYITHSIQGKQSYELIIRSRYKYPKPGYEDGRIIGNISWEM